MILPAVILTPAQGREIADLLRYGPSHADADRRDHLRAILLNPTTQKETRP